MIFKANEYILKTSGAVGFVLMRWKEGNDYHVKAFCFPKGFLLRNFFLGHSKLLNGTLKLNIKEASLVFIFLEASLEESSHSCSAVVFQP